jgi:molybdopterin-guanine dinucleotide biosynthesis protein A
MLGIVLCGGKSTRMGADKGMITTGTDSWARIAFDKLSSLSLTVSISVNADQYPDYLLAFPDTPLIKDNESLQLKGPLCGVLSAHLQYPDEDLLILACDMPLLEPALLKELMSHYDKEPAADAFVFTNDGEPEPLCGIYKASGLATIIQLLQSGQLPKHSMKYMIEHIRTILIPVADDQKQSFRNFNAHADLNGL